MPCYLLGDGEDTCLPPDAREPFAVGSKAMYRGEPVTVTAVHTDDPAGPYYTIALRGGGVRDVDELEEPTPESFYVEYNALHQYLGAPVRAMAPVPPQALYLRPLLANLWLGKGATTSPLHYDEYENLLAQVSGTKELVLFPPSDLPHLYYTPRAKGTLRYAWPNTFERLPVREADAGARVVFASSVNVSQPDLRAHPALQRASPRRCTLRPGETLYLPAFWHHEVHSRCAAQGELNVAVNFWFRNATRPPEGFP